MPTEQYFGMRLTTERRNLLQRIAAATGAAYDDTTFANLRRDEVEPYIAVICAAWEMDPSDRGTQASAVDFALKMAAVMGSIEPREGETALVLALRVTAEQVEG